jgi:predicted DNA-binding transcriptional regulator AlpA
MRVTLSKAKTKASPPPKKQPKSLAERAARFLGEFVGTPFVCQRYGISRVTAWKWEKDGTLPRSIKLADNCKRWLRSDLEKWEKEKQRGAAA